MRTRPRAFIVMPFGLKPGLDGTPIDFDAIYESLLKGAVSAAGLDPHRADADRHGGSIHADMFQDLLLAEFVVADLTIDNPNVWYELGVRHALRAGGTLLVASRTKLPFDIAGQRTQKYTLVGGALDPGVVAAEQAAITAAIEATLLMWRGRPVSPVYQQLPNLKEPDWKTLRVGAVNQLWDALDQWQTRVEAARQKGRPGDILVLAEETPNTVLAFEALRTAGGDLLKLKQPDLALQVLEEARALDPDDRRARQLEGTALGRVGRFVDARARLEELAREHRDGETLGLLARTYKDEWVQLWSQIPDADAARHAASEASATLQLAVDRYHQAFQENPADYFPGINALTLGRLWEHLTEDRSSIDLKAVRAGLAWCVSVAVARARDYWPLASLGELAMIDGDAEAAQSAYRDAAALAVNKRDRFALDSSLQQLRMLLTFGFNVEAVRAAIEVLERAEGDLQTLVGVPAAQPERVVVFSGHMIDDPAVRGPGQAKPARFPADRVDAVARAIGRYLDAIGATRGDVGLCGGACGGDLLFAEACLARGVQVELRLAKRVPQFMAESVTFADPDRRWERSFDTVSAQATTRLILPDELGPAPEGVSVHDRCNRWIVYSALARGIRKTSFLAVWDGKAGDGPGGTQGMIDLVRQMTGRQPTVIDPMQGELNSTM